MIVGIGCDVVEHATTDRLNWESDINLLERIFSPLEIELYNSDKSIKFIAGRFAAKEAVVKCLGTGIYDGISLAHIQILRSSEGKPVVELSGLAKQVCDNMKINLWHVTITHASNCSVAFVVAERN